MFYKEIELLSITKNKKMHTTRGANKDFNDMRNSSPASILLYPDSVILRNPVQAILPNVRNNPPKCLDDNLRLD